MGTVVDSAVDFYGGRLTRAERKGTLTEQLLADQELTQVWGRGCGGAHTDGQGLGFWGCDEAHTSVTRRVEGVAVDLTHTGGYGVQSLGVMVEITGVKVWGSYSWSPPCGVPLSRLARSASTSCKTTLRSTCPSRSARRGQQEPRRM